MITRHGWTAVVAAAACFGVGRVFGLIELYVVGVGIVIALLVAIPVGLLAAPRVGTVFARTSTGCAFALLAVPADAARHIVVAGGGGGQERHLTTRGRGQRYSQRALAAAGTAHE